MSFEIRKNQALAIPYMTLTKQNGVLICRFTDKLDIDLDVALVCTQVRMDFCQALSYPVLFDLRGVKGISRQAREYLAGEGSRMLITAAFLGNSPVSMLIGTIFQRINRLLVPTRLFAEEETALHWLRNHYWNN
ncbi:MAG: hypothetical protein AB1458_05780 [Bacteroidota bacterium]